MQIQAIALQKQANANEGKQLQIKAITFKGCALAADPQKIVVDSTVSLVA